MKNKHNKTLEQICRSPIIINEDRNKIVSIFREPIWLKENSSNLISMPDIIICYEFYAVPIEVKGTQYHIEKAKNQLHSGSKFIRDRLNLSVNYGKIVLYADGLSFIRVDL